MSAANEIAQWVVLAFLSVFVLGLTRQLGGYITSTRELKAENEGPLLGKVVPPALIAPAERSRLAELMRARDVRWAAVMVVSEDCHGCSELVKGIEEDGMPDGAPLVLLGSRATEAHRAQLARVADVVVVDEGRVKQSNVTATPFCMVVDEEFRLVAKAIGKRFESMLEELREPDVEPGADEPITVSVRSNGRDSGT